MASPATMVSDEIGPAHSMAAASPGGGTGGKLKPTFERTERSRITRGLGFLTVLALFITGTLTFLILFGLTPLEPNRTIIAAALAANTALALVLIVLIGLEVQRLLKSRQRGRAAARLHIRIVGLFALVAAIPAILVAIVASITLDLGLDRWFELRTKQIVEGSVSVAEAYVEESSMVHVNATISMANELDRARQLYSLDRTAFANMLDRQTRGRGMLSAQLLRGDGSPILKSTLAEGVALPDVPTESLEESKSGDIIFIPRGRTNLVGAVMKLRVIPDAFLFTIRPLREDVLASLRQMEVNTDDYNELESSRLPVQLTFAVLYLGVALMILLAAIWMGISVADRFVRPIRRLIHAADAVSEGNLDVHVDTSHSEGDFKNLSDTFNVMTTQLKEQRNDLLQANEDIDARARFIEAVLSGVTAAVIGVDKKGVISISNTTARTMLGDGVAAGKPVGEAFSELGEVLDNAQKSGKAEYLEQITTMIDGQSRTLNVQVTEERERAAEHSSVITVDDITDLVAAQRSTAWSDVARRIAHEIKNPLTPIQLSAERIRKRYSKYITEDREVFDQCTDTIVRHVGDIGRMVDEFSSFARMPKPQMAVDDLTVTVREAVFTQRVANPGIEYKLDIAKGEFAALYDERLISQALINVIKNASEAIEAVDFEKTGKDDAVGRIDVRMWPDGHLLVVDVIDNGKGLPVENRQQLLEPYMTTRRKGTGLGLAIVRKIMEDHGGAIELQDAPQVAKGGSGAMVRLRIPAAEAQKQPVKASRESGKAATAKPGVKPGKAARKPQRKTVTHKGKKHKEASV